MVALILGKTAGSVDCFDCAVSYALGARQTWAKNGYVTNPGSDLPPPVSLLTVLDKKNLFSEDMKKTLILSLPFPKGVNDDVNMTVKNTAKI
jgi:hypothetical protein